VQVLLQQKKFLKAHKSKDCTPEIVGYFNIMKIQDAINRLSYTVSKGNKPNQPDILALNKVISDLNKSSQETTQNHILFAKLYAICLRDFSKHYNDVDFANTMINKELSLSLDYQLQLLELELNRISLQEYFLSKNITDPLLKKENFDRYKHLFGLTEIFDNWDKENLKANFEASVNQSIINFKNHV
jgi:hypothetical protein